MKVSLEHTGCEKLMRLSREGLPSRVFRESSNFLAHEQPRSQRGCRGCKASASGGNTTPYSSSKLLGDIIQGDALRDDAVQTQTNYYVLIMIESCWPTLVFEHFKKLENQSQY